MTCHAPLKCWAACRVDFQTLSTATIISFFFFSCVLEGVLSRNFLRINRTGVDAAVTAWLWTHLAWQQGRERKGTEENTEAERIRQKMKQKIVNSLTLLDRTVFCALCKLTRVYLQIELRHLGRELWNDLSLLQSWKIWALTAAAQGSTKAPLWNPVYKCVHMEAEQREPVLGQSLVVRLSSYVCQCVQC